VGDKGSSGLDKVTIIKHARQVLKQYKKDEGGNIAMLFGLMFMTLLLAVGVGYDYSQLTHAYSKSQSVADQMALQAAVYVKNNGAPPTSSQDGLVDGHTYTAEELGHQYNAFVRDGASGVTIRVEYDEENKEATAFVQGKTVPAFLQVFNYGDLTFHANSVANYEQLAPQDAASIVLVLDNSGSMAFDDKQAIIDYPDHGNPHQWDDYSPAPDGIRRIQGLKDSAKAFMDHLDAMIGPQTTVGERILRTSMLAYNEDLIAARTVEPKWGTVSDSSINSMIADGATNSSPPMTLASTWLEGEDAVHIAETGEDKPLKFVIFMTDGQNTTGNLVVTPGDTGRWYANKCLRPPGHKTQRCQWWFAPFQFDSDFVEGTLTLATDSETLASCEAMKAEGIIIYTIAFALQPGWYYTNEWGVGNSNPDYKETSQQVHNAANGLMSGCASSEALFIEADDSEALDNAFQQIANHIVTELIRIKS